MAKEENRKKLSKMQIRAIIIAVISAACVLALIITNIFIPVKYLSSYFVIRNKAAGEGVLRVRFVDVGYGDCTIIELPDGKTMLIDGGDGKNKNEHKILKFLNESNIDTIDYLVCTTPKKEHCGGLIDIVRYKTVKNAYIPYCTNLSITDEYYNFVNQLDKDIINYIQYGEGFSSEEYGYFFSFLSPSRINNSDSEYNALNKNPTNANANSASAVCWLEYNGVGFLLTGDASEQVFEKILKDYQMMSDTGSYCKVGENSVNFENCKVFKVAGHGAKSSVCTPFTDILHQDYSVVSVGENNFGCPSAEALTVTGEILRTDKKGTVTFEVTEQGYLLEV